MMLIFSAMASQLFSHLQGEVPLVPVCDDPEQTNLFKAIVIWLGQKVRL